MPGVAIKGLTRHYGDVAAVENLSLEAFAFFLVAGVSHRVRHALFEDGRARAQLVVGELFERRFELIDLRDDRLNRLQKTLIATAEYFG